MKGHTFYVIWGQNAGGVHFEWADKAKRLVLWKFAIGWWGVDVELLIDHLKVNK